MAEVQFNCTSNSKPLQQPKHSLCLAASMNWGNFLSSTVITPVSWLMWHHLMGTDLQEGLCWVTSLGPKPLWLESKASFPSTVQVWGTHCLFVSRHTIVYFCKCRLWLHSSVLFLIVLCRIFLNSVIIGTYFNVNEPERKYIYSSLFLPLFCFDLKYTKKLLQLFIILKISTWKMNRFASPL